MQLPGFRGSGIEGLRFYRFCGSSAQDLQEKWSLMTCKKKWSKAVATSSAPPPPPKKKSSLILGLVYWRGRNNQHISADFSLGV